MIDAKPKPLVPLGRALVRTEGDLARLATITPVDVAQAVRLWDETAPTQVRGLMHATEAKP